ncbi:MAG: VacJ family lipoprotein, partial [Caulobacterales bacterium]
MRPLRLIVLAGMSALLAAAPTWAARAAPAGVPEDPFEGTNRALYSSHSGLDNTFFRPLAKLYHALTPGPIGKAIHNVLVNLSEPVVIANDLLQARFGRATHDTLRFTANSTAGWLGLMDVAGGAGLPHQDNDFGVTLGRWGVGPGPYLFIPLVGPSTVRDAIGLGADSVLNPLTFINYPGRATANITQQVVGGLDIRDRSDADLQALMADAADPYATLRSVYLQNREAMVRGEEAAPALPPIEDAPAAQPTTDQPTPSPAATAPAPAAAAGAPIVQADAETAAAPDPDAPMVTAGGLDARWASRPPAVTIGASGSGAAAVSASAWTIGAPAAAAGAG